MATKTILPALPSYIDERNLKDAVQALSEIAGVWLGERSDPLDRVVTIRDLVDADMAAVIRAGRTLALAPLELPELPDGDADGALIYSPPPAPENFTAVGGIGVTVLSWGNPDSLYANHAYTEIWRASVNDLGQAVLQDKSPSFIWTDYNVDSGSAYFYWIRFVSTAGVFGPYSEVRSTGVSHDPAYLMDVLTDAYGDTSDSPFFRLDTATTINGVEVPAGTYIKDAFIHNATITSMMVESGFLTNLTAVHGTIDTALINMASIWDLQIGDVIESSNYAAGSRGWRITKGGHFEFQSGVIGSSVSIGGTSASDLESSVSSLESSVSSLDSSVSSLDSSVSSLDSSVSVFNTWVKPATTLINGNKIYTGDAYVDTLQIKNQAVTFPVSFYSSGSVPLADHAWVTVASVTMSCTGAPVSIVASALGACLRVRSYEVSIELKARLLVDSTTLIHEVLLGADSKSIEGGPNLVASLNEYLTVSIGHQPSPGTHTFNLQLYVGGWGTLYESSGASRRSIFVLETKR